MSRPQDHPAFNPIGRFFPNTQYETAPFNFKYRNYEETFSFLVPEVNHRTVEFLLHRPGRDNAADIKKWAIEHIGREWDAARCLGIAIRTTPQGRLEIRLKFSVPWYWEEFEREVCERHGIPYRAKGSDASIGQDEAGPVSGNPPESGSISTVRG